MGDAGNLQARLWRTTSLPVGIVAYLAAYVFLDWVSYIQPVGSFPITPWNPPPGLSLAFLLRTSPRQGAWLFVAAVCAEVVVRGFGTPAWVVFAACVVPACAYTVVAALLRRVSSGDPLESLRNLARLLAIALVGTLVVAMGLVLVYHAAGLLQHDLAAAVAQSWIGDFIGIAVTTPAVLLLLDRPAAWRLRAAHLLPFLAIGGAFWIVFGSGGQQDRLFYLLFLPLVWIAVQQGLGGAVAALVGIQIGLVGVLAHRGGVLLDFQFLMLALCLTGLLVGAAVSDRRRIERELNERQFELDRGMRLAAASELASALAHELQQPLTALNNYVRAAALMATRADGDRAPLQETMDKAVAQTERASQVVRSLRDFFRTGAIAPEPVDPRTLADAAAAAVANRLARHGIALDVSHAEALPRVRADRVQIEGVLGNLLANAIDAVKTRPDDRRVRLSLRRAGDQVAFTVEDNGLGVAPDVEARLFERFATSKPRGMGLGLAMSRSIVEAHGGHIAHLPRAGGATFEFTLPAAR